MRSERPLSLAPMAALLGCALMVPPVCPLAALQPHVPAGEFLRGMAMGEYSDVSEPAYAQKLDEVKALGVSHVSVVIAWSSRDVRDAEIAPRDGQATKDPVLARMMRQAHDKGLGVLLFPIIDVRKRKPLEWRGTLRPTNWNTWWTSYRRFIMHYAALAASQKVEILCVGSELVSTEAMRDHWVSLIRDVRRVFRGKLIYSANWDHYRPVSFWDQVDIMGVTGYHRIADSLDAPESEMVQHWLALRDDLENWAATTGRPFVFTEIGYPSMDGTAMRPWDYTGSYPPDMEEQRRAYSAFVTAWSASSSLMGVFFWDWYGPGGPKDTRYTTRDKPAAQVVRGWYQRKLQ